MSPISIVHASAGTGKTYCLTEQFANLLLSQKNVSIDDLSYHQIIATTFTNKAADELMERIQSRLIADGAYKLAQLIRGSYIGTVNSICGRLVSEYALEGGLSPSINVLDEIRQRRVFIASSEGSFGAFADRLGELAYRLSVEDWRNDVLRIVDLARQNDIAKQDLLLISENSWKRLNQLLPEPLSDHSANRLDEELTDAIRIAVNQLNQTDDDTRITQEALEFLNSTLSTLEKQRILPWSVWARLSKLKVASKQQARLAKLRSTASQYLRHPRIRSDWREMIENVLLCALSSMDEYSSFKIEHGLIDFADQERLARSLLDSGLITKDLSEKCKILMVDEFQDTSPIQLAVFLKLAQSLQSSLWVGDIKQSIFGFRGADPELMHKVSSSLIAETGGTETKLNTSYRSRPELVLFANTLFSMCMPAAGITEDMVRISKVARHAYSALESSIQFWWLNGKTFEEALNSLSSGLLAVLKQPDRFMVHDKEMNRLRPIVGSDIAILCRSNDHRLQLAAQLTATGIPVTTERKGLLDTPECVLAVAALRFMVDPYDSLAAGTIVRFWSSDDEWLSKWLQMEFTEFAQSIPILQAIIKHRIRLTHLTPSETLQLAIVGSGILEIIKRLGNFRQRALNLDALRGLAREYEDDCLAVGRAATAAGLVARLHEGLQDSMQPPSPSKHGVNVLTYHKAKGLEWPLVVLFDLENVNSGTAFGVTAEQASELDIAAPLNGRTIRYWPWPYGRQRVEVDLGNTPTSKEALVASQKVTSESIRLMYVGVTRARDYLIFAARPTTEGTDWLKELKDSVGQPALSLPYKHGLHEILCDSMNAHCADMKILNPIDAQSSTLRNGTSSFTTPPPTQWTEKIPYRLVPSKLATDNDKPSSYRVADRTTLGPRIVLVGTEEIQRVGDVVHHFFAADDLELTLLDRIQLGREILSHWQMTAMKPQDLVLMANRLKNALAVKFPGSSKFVECPVSGFKGDQRIRGSIDLLLHTETGYVVIDHKTYPGPASTWESKALSHARQLFAYKDMVEGACLQSVIGCYIHLPLLGQLFEISACV